MSGIQEFNFKYRQREDDFSSFFSQFEEPSQPEVIEEELTDEEKELEREKLLYQNQRLDPNRTVLITQSMKDVVGFLQANRPVDKDAKKQKGIRGFVDYLNLKMGYVTHLTPKEWEGLKEIYRVELNKRSLD